MEIFPKSNTKMSKTLLRQILRRGYDSFVFTVFGQENCILTICADTVYDLVLHFCDTPAQNISVFFHNDLEAFPV